MANPNRRPTIFDTRFDLTPGAANRFGGESYANIAPDPFLSGRNIFDSRLSSILQAPGSNLFGAAPAIPQLPISLPPIPPRSVLESLLSISLQNEGYGQYSGITPRGNREWFVLAYENGTWRVTGPSVNWAGPVMSMIGPEDMVPEYDGDGPAYVAQRESVWKLQRENIAKKKVEEKVAKKFKAKFEVMKYNTATRMENEIRKANLIKGMGHKDILGYSFHQVQKKRPVVDADQAETKWQQTQLLPAFMKKGSPELVRDVLQGQTMVRTLTIPSSLESGKSITAQNPRRQYQQLADQTNAMCSLQDRTKQDLKNMATQLGIKVVSKDLKYVICQKIIRHLQLIDPNVSIPIDNDVEIQGLDQ